MTKYICEGCPSISICNNKYQKGTCCYADNIDELKDNILEETILACKQDDNYAKAVRKLIKGE